MEKLLTWVFGPKLYGDGVHDDTIALQALFDNRKVRMSRNFRAVRGYTWWFICNAEFLVSKTLTIPAKIPVKMPISFDFTNCLFIGINIELGKPLFYIETTKGLLSLNNTDAYFS